jgi:curli biogenesis system outer membrane secretion channel CsgG
MKHWILLATGVAVLGGLVSEAVTTPAQAQLDLGKLKPKRDDKNKDKDKKDGSDSGLTVDLPPYFGPKKRIAVTEIELKVTPGGGTTAASPQGTVDIPPPTDFGTGLTEMLNTSLFKTNRFILLERSDKGQADIKKEQDFNKDASQVDQATAVQSGKQLGAQVLVRASITEYTFRKSNSGGKINVLKGVDLSRTDTEASIKIDVRMYDTTTGQIIASTSAEGKAKASATSINVDRPDYKVGGGAFNNSPLGHAVRQAMEKAVIFISKEMESQKWEARVMDIDQDEGKPVTAIYINAGSLAGIKVGDELILTQPGRPLKDPETGLFTGRHTKGKVRGRCKVESVDDKVATLVPISGEGFAKDDLARFPEKGD